MAIGDAVAAFLGAGEENRQPASGVEEQISSIVKPGATDLLVMYDGTNSLNVLAAAATTPQVQGNGAAIEWNIMNIAIMITNTVYIRKAGTTDRVYLGGVQTNV